VWNDILDLAISNGLFAVLFLIMLVYVLRDSSIREQKYQNTIDKLASHYAELKMLKEQVDDMSTNVDEIKQDLRQVVNEVGTQKRKRTTKTKKENSTKSTVSKISTQNEVRNTKDKVNTEENPVKKSIILTKSDLLKEGQ